jgi:tRNA (cytidine32/guanosine34-2'-O)-methyltransferase
MGKTSKDKRDIYYRLAKEQGWRARSAFKLLHLDEQYGLFEGVTRVVDLCAAPGSWSQVLSKQVRDSPSRRIVAVDLQPMAPIPGVHQLQGDITLTSTAEAVIQSMDGKKAELVVCDGAPDVTGLHEMDEYMQSQLLFAALHITLHVLEENGTFVAKMFRGVSTDLVFCQLRMLFAEVSFCKPASSRASSYECFVVARGLHIPPDLPPASLSKYIQSGYKVESLKGFSETVRQMVPFFAHGDLSGFDSETTVSLPQGHVSMDPVQPPTAPPYKAAVEERRQEPGATSVKGSSK